MISLTQLHQRIHYVLLAVLAAVLTGLMVSGKWLGLQGAALIVFVPLGLAVLEKPLLGLGWVFPVVMLIPHQVIDLPLPVFDSPVQLVLIPVLVSGIARLAFKETQPLFTGLYLPMAACVVIMGVNLALGRGPDTGFLLYRFLLGLWPFFFSVVLVEKSRHARRFLLSALVPVIFLVIFWLPIIIWFGLTQEPVSIIRMAKTSPTSAFGQEYPILSLLNPGGPNRTWVVLIVAPVLLSTGLLSERAAYRTLGRAGYLLCGIFLCLSTLVAAITFFVLETLMVFVLARWLGRPKRGYAYLIVMVFLVFLITVLIGFGDNITTRFQLHLDPGRVVLGESRRIGNLRNGLRLAMRYPLFGIGGYQGYGRTWAGEDVQGHNFWFAAVYQFGVFYAAAWIAIVAIVCRRCWVLLRGSSGEEKMVLLGMFVGLIVTVLHSFVNPVLSAPGPDIYFWLFAGLISVWYHWRRLDPQAVLLA